MTDDHSESDRYFANAVDYREDGDLSNAGRFYALSSFTGLVESGYSQSNEMRDALTRMLLSMSADLRAGNERRATIHFEMVEPVFRMTAKTAKEPAIRGLAKEWIGDGYLMTESHAANGYYREARQVFRQLSFSEVMFWGAVPEFDNAFGAVRSYLEFQGFEQPVDHSTAFVERIDYKLEALESISPDDNEV